MQQNSKYGSQLRWQAAQFLKRLGMSRSEIGQLEQDICSAEQAGSVEKIAAKLRDRGWVGVRMQGVSMLPWVRPGDLAIIGKVAISKVNCGDIVLFHRAERLFVHRIVSRVPGNETAFVAKGDANPEADGVLTADDILGRVEQIYRGGKAIELQSRGERALGRVIAHISRRSRVWIALVRTHAMVARPVRRMLGALRPFRAAAR